MEFAPFLTHFLAGMFFLYVGVQQISALGIWKPMWAAQFYIISFGLLMTSAMYHGLPDGELRDIFNMMDYMMIFVLIASSFSAIHGVVFEGFWGWGAACIAWAVAITLILARLLYNDVMPYWAWATVYLIAGWMGAISFKKLLSMYYYQSLLPILYGALAYTIGFIQEVTQFDLVGLDYHSSFHIWVVIGLWCHWHFVTAVLHNHKYLVKKDI